MSEQPHTPEENRAETKAAALTGASQLAIDLGPLLIFVVIYNVLNRTHPANAIYIATGTFIAATLIAIVYSWFKTRHIPPILIVTGVLITVFGGLTIYLHDENFVKLKPTFMNGFYAVAILGSLAFGQNVWKLLLQHTFVLPDKVWKILAIRWGLFFIFLAVLNEIIRNNADTAFWVNSRLMITFPLTIVFAALNAPLTLKYAGKTEMDPS
jgi:intracellular septation protein